MLSTMDKSLHKWPAAKPNDNKGTHIHASDSVHTQPAAAANKAVVQQPVRVITITGNSSSSRGSSKNGGDG